MPGGRRRILRDRRVHVVISTAPTRRTGLLQKRGVQTGRICSVGIGIVDVQQNIGVGIDVGGRKSGLGGRGSQRGRLRDGDRPGIGYGIGSGVTQIINRRRAIGGIVNNGIRRIAGNAHVDRGLVKSTVRRKVGIRDPGQTTGVVGCPRSRRGEINQVCGIGMESEGNIIVLRRVVTPAW